MDSEQNIRYNTLDKKAQAQKMETIYSTEKITKILADKGKGLQVDTGPFFHGDPEWKDAGIIYEYTEEEMAELRRCAEDPVYFIENYCKFLNDKGRTTVKLRDYQKDIIKTMGAEVYSPELDVMIPENRQIVLLQSRQSAKCVTYNTAIETFEGHKKKIGELYNEKPTFIRKIINLLYSIYEAL